jgi:hypothetical protein
VSHEVAEQELQFVDEDFTRLPPPPIPKDETSFWISLAPQFTQMTLFSPPMEVRISKEHPHVLQENS